MPSLASYKKARSLHNERRQKDKVSRKVKAVNAAVSLTLGDPTAGWVLGPDGSNSVIRTFGGSTITLKNKKDRLYRFDPNAVNARVEGVKKEREEKAKAEAEKKAKAEAEKIAKEEAERVEAEKKAQAEAEEKAKVEAEEKAKESIPAPTGPAPTGEGPTQP
jgi:flagellar biosynthesis GTPase FlhF